VLAVSLCSMKVSDNWSATGVRIRSHCTLVGCRHVVDVGDVIRPPDVGWDGLDGFDCWPGNAAV
jgi:hypothetical protein